MKSESIKNKLLGKNPGKYEIIIAGYIVWQLEQMSNRELAETTADEIEKGVFKMKDILSAVKGEARKKAVDGCAVLEDSEAFGIVRKHLHIDAAVSEEEASGFVPTAYKPRQEEKPRKAALSLEDIWED